MAVNFCHEYLGSRILCSQVMADNYKIENLISDDLTSRNRGFLADSFVRPPVDIILQFPCPVKICCISVNSRVGSQQSTGCEIFVQCEQSGGYDAFNYGIFNQVGKYYWDCDKKGVYIVSALHSASCRSLPAENFARQDINGRMNKSLSSVWSLRIRIVKTSGSSIPALGSLSVWGPDVIDARKSGTNTNTEASQIAGAAAEDDFEIPEEFLDGLTCEIMSMPVRLPSGNVIDERTLERFAKQEASWGRPPSDPFTAKPISASHRPIYDTALKARIDSFLLKESHRPCLKNCPRTTGPIQTRSSDTLLQLGDVPKAADKRPSTSVPSVPAPPQPAVIDPSRKWLSNVASSLQHLTGRRTTTTTVRSKGPASSSSDATGVVVVKPTTANNNTSPCVCGFQDVRPVYSLPCSHRICRSCLLDMKATNSLSCRWCQLPFALHEPVLQHRNP
ncbi:RING finger protein 37-like isoform X2 [Daphnia pulex]|uniref:RING finger protein 37-like isoform X2 n=1 Tax=Daphnia pulex TaxID=6669 RepID=UPI001EDE40F1|nr:RING finger protein 37-like isoform X2 [Daphnia pulex]